MTTRKTKVSERAKVVIAQIRKAKWEVGQKHSLKCTCGIDVSVSAEDFRRPRTTESSNIRFDGAPCQYTPAAVRKAKAAPVVLPLGKIGGYNSSLNSKGILTIGCQSHTLAAWLKGAGQDRVQAEADFTGDVSVISDLAVVIPVLRAKLAAYKKQQAAKQGSEAGAGGGLAIPQPGA
jgi:hypothetical protein